MHSKFPNSPKLFLAAALTLFFETALLSQTLTWDANGITTGQTNGAGTWTAANLWWDGASNVTWANSGNEIAQFGTTASAAGGTITTGAINLAGLNFTSFSATPTAIYNLSGGSLTFASGQAIQIADSASTASLFATIGSQIIANNLTVRKMSGTAHQFMRFDNTSNSLSGTLTMQTGGGGVFLRIAGTGTLGTVTQVNIEATNTMALLNTAAATYTQAFQIAGSGDQNRGAIRIDSSNLTLSGNIVMTADSTLNINTNINNTTLSGVIGESGGSRAFTRISQNPGMIVRLTGANTYSGATNLGGTSISSGGITLLDFSASGAPVSNILYNGVPTPGGINLAGGTAGGSFLAMTGNAGAANTQALGNISVTGTTTGISATSGTGGSMSLTTGIISRSANAAIAITSAATGTITVGNSTGFMGTWATFMSGAGIGSWSTVGSGGVLANFTGNLLYTSGSNLSSAGATSDLRVSDTSVGNVVVSGAATTINTLTMTDVTTARMLALSGTDILRVGGTGAGGGGNVAGGFQMITGAQTLTIGSAPGAGVITGGGAANTVGQIAFTNFSSQPMLVNSSINNNGSGGQNVLINGSGRVVFLGGGNYSADTIVASGILEIRNNAALGVTTSNLTRVMEGASLYLGGGITTPEALAISGNGVNSGGALRNIDGSNTVTGLVTLIAAARIHSESGTLTFGQSGSATANAITGTGGVTFSGAGNITVLGKLNLTTGTLSKEGTGTLTISGDSSTATAFSGTATVNGGVMRMTSGNGLGTAAVTIAENVTIGGALELSGGITVANGITVSGTGINSNSAVNGAGAIRNVSGTNTLSGTLVVGTLATTPRISADASTTLILSGTVRSGATAAGTRNVQLGGAGIINITGQITNGTTPATFITALDKVEGGTVNLRAASTLTPNTASPTTLTVNVRGGTLNFDFANATPTSALVPSTNNLGLGGNGTSALNSTTLLGSAMGGGTVLFSGKDSVINTQNFAGTTLAGGRSAISLVSGASGTMNVALGPITRGNSSGSAVNLTLPASGTLSTTTPNTNGIINGGITVGNATWATSAATAATNVAWTTSGITLAGYTNGQQVSFTGTAPGGLTAGVGYFVVNATASSFQLAATEGGAAITLTNTGTTASMNTGGAITGLVDGSYSATFATSTNVDVASGSLSQAAVTVNSLRFNKAAGTTLSLSGTLTNSSGGILVTSAVTAPVTIQSSVAGTSRTLSSSTPADFTIHHHGSGLLTFSSDIVLSNATGFTKTGPGAMTFAGSSASTGIQIRATEGTLNFTGTNQFTSGTDPTIYFGSATTSAKVSFGNGASTGAETLTAMYVLGPGSSLVGNGSQVFTLSMLNTGIIDLRALTIGGTGTNENNLALEIYSGGTVMMGAANTYAGRTNIGRSTLEASVIANTGTASSLGTGSAAGASAIVMNDTNSTSATVSTLRYLGAADATTDRPVRLYTDGTSMPSLTAVIENNGAGTLKFTSPFTAEGNTTLPRTMRLGGTNTGTNEMVGIGNGPGSTVSLDKTGSGTWVLTGNSSYTGGTTITAGTLQLGNGGTAGTIGSGDVAISSGATFAFNRSDAGLVISNTIIGSGQVRHIGSGTTTMSGANTYSGGTSVSAGTLLVTNTTGSGTGSGAVTTAAGSTLGGNGTIAPTGTNSVMLSGTVAPSNSGTAGALKFTPVDGNVTFQSTSNIVFELFGNGNNDKLIHVATGAGVLDFSAMTAGSISVTFVGGYTPSLGHSFDVLDWSGVSGLSTGLLSLPTTGFDPSWAWDTSQFTTNGTLSIGLVPEPGRGAMAMAGFAAWRMRRRR